MNEASEIRFNVPINHLGNMIRETREAEELATYINKLNLEKVNIDNIEQVFDKLDNMDYSLRLQVFLTN